MVTSEGSGTAPNKAPTPSAAEAAKQAAIVFMVYFSFVWLVVVGNLKSKTDAQPVNG